MKLNILFYTFLILTGIFTSCKKDQNLKSDSSTNTTDTTNTSTDSTIIFSEPNVYDYKYIITLNPDRTISNIKYYTKESLFYNEDYTYAADKITRVNFNIRLDTIISKSTFYLENNLAVKSTDSAFKTESGYTTTITNKTYTYNQNQEIIQTTRQILKKTGDSIIESQSNFITLYTFEYANIVTIERGPYKCRDELKYNSIIPTFNVNALDDNIITYKSQNLISTATLQLGCPTAPGGHFPIFNYAYKLDADNYVITCLKDLTFTNSRDPNQKPKRTIIAYEYIK